MDKKSISSHVSTLHEQVTNIFAVANGFERAINKIDNRNLKEEAVKGIAVEREKVSISEDLEWLSKRLDILAEKLAMSSNNLENML